SSFHFSNSDYNFLLALGIILVPVGYRRFSEVYVMRDFENFSKNKKFNVLNKEVDQFEEAQRKMNLNQTKLQSLVLELLPFDNNTSLLVSHYCRDTQLSNVVKLIRI